MAISSTSSTSSFKQHLIQLSLTLHGTDCPICLEDIDPRDVSFTLPCNHKFDRRCIMEWVQTGTIEDVRCPACRTTIENVIGGWDYVEELKLWMYGGLGKRYPETSRLIALQLELRLFWLERQPTKPRWLVNARLTRFPVVESIYLIRRLLVYHLELRCKYTGSNPISKYKEVTSSTIAKDTALVERARRFIKRELSILQHYMTEKERDKYVQGVINVISSVDFKLAGGKAEMLIHETLKHVSRTHAEIFAHELHSFLRSPYKTVLEWDSHAQYEVRGGFPDRSEANGGADYGHQFLALLDVYQPRLSNNGLDILINRSFAANTPILHNVSASTPNPVFTSTLSSTAATPVALSGHSTPLQPSPQHTLPGPDMIWSKIHDHPNPDRCIELIETVRHGLPDVFLLIIQVQRSHMETETTLQEFEPRRLQRARPLSEMT